MIVGDLGTRLDLYATVTVCDSKTAQKLEKKYLEAHERQQTERWAKQNHECMRRRTHNMQNNCWPLELPEDATEKPHMQITHAHAKNAAGTPPKYW